MLYWARIWSRRTASLALCFALVGGFLFSVFSLQPARASGDGDATPVPTVQVISTEVPSATETPALEPSVTLIPSIDLTPAETLIAVISVTPIEDTGTTTPLPIKTGLPTSTSTPGGTTTAPPEGTETPTATPPTTEGSTSTPTLTATPTSIATATGTATVGPLSAAAGAVVINEVAWGGTAASSFDEWIELYNPGAAAIDLGGWTVSDGGDISITLAGTIAAGGYFLLERTDDTTISDIPADQFYTGGLNNTGEALTLRDAGANVIDAANGDGGPWPAGSGAPSHHSMERLSAVSPDTDANWASNNGVNRNGLDAAGNPINGTPRQPNSPPVAPTPSPTPAAYPPLAVTINEVAWAGTTASGFDEWIELYNPGAAAIDLGGWTLSDGGDINITLAGTIAASGYFLLERTDDSTISDIPADVIYTGGLNNTGETLTLRDPISNVVDTANADGGPWPAGSDASFASMERLNVGPEGDGNWQSNNGFTVNGHDAGGSPLRATPRSANSSNFPVPTATPFTGIVLINEFLPHPSSGAQEFVEVINLGPEAVDLSGWQLDDAEGGTSPYTLPPGTLIQPSGLLVGFQDTTGIALNDDGDSARLLRPDGSVADEWSYGRDPGVDVSWARIPDGGGWNGRGIPTPGQSNRAAPEPPAATPVPIGVFRAWPDGAWVTVVGRASAPPLVFGTRTIHIQDDTGGVTVYLGRGEWPQMVVGQSIKLLGYLRHQSGDLQLYVRNLWHLGVGSADDIAPVAPFAVSTGQIGEATEGALVATTGVVVRLEPQAFWIDDGSGAARVFFSAYTGLSRPLVRRGEVWAVTGVVVENTTVRSAAPNFRLQPRFASDFALLTGPDAAVLPTSLPPPAEAIALPTEEPTATPEP